MFESDNFLWSGHSILGRGATATVYQGANKTNGDSVAVKCYNIAYVYQIREFEVLRTIHHENIVNLIANEETHIDRKLVLVMELCTGGSLLDNLMDPKNFYGLEEPEFLLVFKHILRGIKYLRDNNIIHRDLKPGNIMKFIKEDGIVIYKISDFGAAKQLTDDETFQSICGTKPYLHPDIYNIAILRNRGKKNFNSSVDLWSIGVTLYHIATGTLPFKAYTDETLYYIITHKDSGVISGVETRDRGRIKWSRTLPKTCLLSDSLKKNIEPIMAGLLESNPTEIWSFDKFFKETDIVQSQIPLNIFHVNQARLLTIYMMPGQKYEDFQQNITDQTNIEPANQIILYKSNFLKNIIQNDTEIHEFPETNEQRPLVLFDKANNDFSITPICIPEWRGFDDNSCVEKDITSANWACIIGHYCNRKIQEYSTYCKLIYDSGHNLMNRVSSDIKELEQTIQRLFDKIQIVDKFGAILLLQNGEETNTYDNKLRNISKQFLRVKEVEAIKLYDIQCLQNIIKSTWEATIENLENPLKTRAIERGNILTEALQKYLEYFKVSSGIGYNNGQWRILEKKKVRKKLNNINLLIKEVFCQYQQLVKIFGNWYSSVQKISSELGDLKTDIKEYGQKFKDFQKELIANNTQFSKEHVNKKLQDVEKEKKLKYFKKALKDYCNNKNKFDEIIVENTKLMNKIQDLKYLDV